jgi:hypothetical protein
VADAAENLNAVLLDLHAPAPAITLLPPMQFVIYLISVKGHAGGQTFDYRDERATV